MVVVMEVVLVVVVEEVEVEAVSVEHQEVRPFFRSTLPNLPRLGQGAHHPAPGGTHRWGVITTCNRAEDRPPCCLRFYY